MLKRIVHIGTRGSALALAQAEGVRRELARRHPKQLFRLSVIRTFGDEFQGVQIFKKTNVGVFTKAIEKALSRGTVDLAIHSLKDLPTDLSGGLVIAAVPKREDARDVLLSRRGFTLKTLPKGSRVGTGSPRRKRQLAAVRPDLKLVDLRGNLDTRVKKVLKERSLDGIVVARAGLLRLKKFLGYARPIDEMLPAVGQGALAVQARKSDKEMLKIAKTIHHPATEKEVSAERAFLKALSGGCRVPVGVRTRVSGGRFRMEGAVFSVKNEGWVRSGLQAPLGKAVPAAQKLAKTLLKNGGAAFLKEARG